MATVYGMLEFKPRLRGSRGHGPKPAEACCPMAIVWQGVIRPSPYPATACCPTAKKRRGMVDLGPEAVEKELDLIAQYDDQLEMMSKYFPIEDNTELLKE